MKYASTSLYINYSLTNVMPFTCTKQMPKPKPNSLSYSMKLIEMEKLNVLKRTDDRIASLQRQEIIRQNTNFSIPLAVCLFALLLYTMFTVSSKCNCICNL